MAATDRKNGERNLGAAVLAAALALPGVCPSAHAESAPENASIGLKFLHYGDSQPGLKRITVNAPSMDFVLPIAGHWALAGSATYDSVSGASPRWHSAVSSASHMEDERKAFDLKLSRYFSRASVTFGTSFSTEHDYESTSYSLLGTLSSDDNNTTWSAGFGYSDDRINPVNNIVTGETKRTWNLLVGVTQVLTPSDIVQANLTYASGNGYYNDPYKMVDNRPRSRDQTALLLRWNHHFAERNATLRTSYRLYHDSFGVTAHTLGAEWVQPLANGWTVTPSVRYSDQSAASFYYAPNYDSLLGEPFPVGYLSNPTGYYSSDHRLSAFGAVTLGIKVGRQIAKDWSADVRLDLYQQRGSWRLLGKGSEGLAPFSAHFIQFGLKHRF